MYKYMYILCRIYPHQQDYSMFVKREQVNLDKMQLLHLKAMIRTVKLKDKTGSDTYPLLGCTPQWQI